MMMMIKQISFLSYLIQPGSSSRRFMPSIFSSPPPSSPFNSYNSINIQFAVHIFIFILTIQHITHNVNPMFFAQMCSSQHFIDVFCTEMTIYSPQQLIYSTFYNIINSFMGCGACIKSNDSQQPTHPQIPPANVLLNLITKYKEIVNHSSTQINLSEEIEAHPVLSLVQCKNLSDFIASTNGQLSDVSNNFNTPDKNLTQLSIANAAGAQTPLLKQEQRIVWKCLLLIPSFIQGPSNKISVPKFKQIITKQQQKVEESFHQISLDVNRTFPKQESLNRESLTLLLRNLVNCLSGIGYTQGMNFYAGFLLLCGFTAQQAYYIAISLFISPDFFIVHNFHSSFKQIFNCNQILNDSLSQKLSSHLNQMGITEQIYSFSWFLCSYLYTFDQKTCAIIWDYMIKSGCCGYEGGGFLSILNIAIIIMQRIQSKLLTCHSPEQTLNFLRFDNLNKLFPPEQISKMLKQMKRKSEKCQNNLDYFKNKHSKANSFRKEFILKKQFMENDKQLKAALTSKQGYQKYIQVAFGLKRDYLKEKNQVHDPKLIKVKGKVNEVQQQ